MIVHDEPISYIFVILFFTTTLDMRSAVHNVKYTFPPRHDGDFEGFVGFQDGFVGLQDGRNALQTA